MEGGREGRREEETVEETEGGREGASAVVIVFFFFPYVRTTVYTIPLCILSVLEYTFHWRFQDLHSICAQGGGQVNVAPNTVLNLS